MNWHELVRNPRAITHLYDDVPSLSGMEVTRVELSPNGPVVSLFMDLPRFANHRPVRWHQAWNTVAMQLDFWDVSDFRLDGFTCNPVLDFSIEREGARLVVVATGADCRMSFHCDSLYIQKVTGYVHEGRVRAG